MTHDLIWGGGGTYLYQHAKNKTMVKIPMGKKKTTKKGDISRKLYRTDTFLLLHPSSKVNDKGLPDILSFESCQFYMGYLKTMFINKFLEK